MFVFSEFLELVVWKPYRWPGASPSADGVQVNLPHQQSPNQGKGCVNPFTLQRARLLLPRRRRCWWTVVRGYDTAHTVDHTYLPARSWRWLMWSKVGTGALSSPKKPFPPNLWVWRCCCITLGHLCSSRGTHNIIYCKMLKCWVMAKNCSLRSLALRYEAFLMERGEGNFVCDRVLV